MNLLHLGLWRLRNYGGGIELLSLPLLTLIVIGLQGLSITPFTFGGCRS